MPRRDDIHSICVLGSGPIVIGQGCEFDYAGCQALVVLREEGYRTIVVNPNPATVMTDPTRADSTYLEPLELASVTAVLRRERPDALLATVGGQTALTLARQLHAGGVLEELGIELIGADIDAIERAEDRQRFRDVVTGAGLQVPAASVVTNVGQVAHLGAPAVVRPAYTLGGNGGGAAWTHDELRAQVAAGLDASPIGQVLVEESLHGWDEYELEVVRDRRDNAVVVCSIENLDPLGVHTGDSVTVAPQMTLSDAAYQQLRDAALRVVRAVGVECGGANVQFARERSTGELRVIEMNPRVSRSSALASKATGYPIAKVAARLAVGYALDEIPNDLTGSTPASFEPALDYVVVKVPRLAFDAFPDASTTLGTRMQAVGEAIGIGRTFGEALGKALRSREGGTAPGVPWHDLCSLPGGMHPWFGEQVARLAAAAAGTGRCTGPDAAHAEGGLAGMDADELLRRKRAGASDAALAQQFATTASAVRRRRAALGIAPAYRAVDSCAGEFATRSAIRYSTWGEQSDPLTRDRASVLIVGSGPNRIGQGIEFDNACVQAALAVRAHGLDPVLVNCNPATVSTDADVSARLYLEPLDVEGVLGVYEHERPEAVFLQFGGQTPLALAPALEAAGAVLPGCGADLLDRAEDRQRFATLVAEVGLSCPEWGIATTSEEALSVADGIGYPVLLRPSHVIGGRSMQVCRTARELAAHPMFDGAPVLVDRFLEHATELDVDALCDGRAVRVVGIGEHVERAGVHSGDSCAVLPPHGVGAAVEHAAADAARRIGLALGIVGTFNLQVAIDAAGTLQVLEVNPRASRTLPFVARATGLEPVAAACRLLLGASLADLELPADWRPAHVAARAPVFSIPIGSRSSLDLGPRMRSTGEVMALADDAKAALDAARSAGAVHCAVAWHASAMSTSCVAAGAASGSALISLQERLAGLATRSVAAPSRRP